jgi:TonB family protein
MKKLIYLYLLGCLIFCLCSRDNDFGLDLYDIQVFLMRGTQQWGQERVPLFPGETSIQYIADIMKNVDDIEKQLIQTFGYQRIEFEDTQGFPFLKQKKDQWFLLRLGKGFYFRLIVFQSSDERSLPIHVTAIQLRENLDPSSGENRAVLLKKVINDKNPILSIRANVPVRQGVILGRALPENAAQALFFIIQPMKLNIGSAEQFMELNKRYKNLDLVYGTEEMADFRFLIARRLNIKDLDELEKSEERKDKPVPNLVPFDSLDFKPKVTKSTNVEYPEKSRKLSEEGMSFILVLVDEGGKVMETELLKSSGFSQLDSSARAAAEKFEFTPALHKGKPVKFELTIPFKFRLTKQDTNEQKE